MRSFAILAAALLVLAGLIAICVAVEAPAIEADLAARTSAAFAEASMPLGPVEVDGRELTLAGELADDAWRSEARAVALGVRGVRTVSFAGVASEPADSATDPRIDPLSREPQGVGGSAPASQAVEIVDGDEAAPVPETEEADLAPEANLTDSQGKSSSEPEGVSEAERIPEPEDSRLAETTPVPESAPATARVSSSTDSDAAELDRRVRRFLRGKTIEFQNTKDELLSASRDVLRQLAPLLAEYPQVALRIEGYTDSRGRPEANLDLSRRRAEAVRAYLIRRGVDGDRLTAIGLGSADPIADNGTPAGRRANRRIEFHVQDEEQD